MKSKISMKTLSVVFMIFVLVSCSESKIDEQSMILDESKYIDAYDNETVEMLKARHEAYEKGE